MATARSFHHITLTVTELERSVEWYTPALRMAKVADREGDGWVRTLMRADGGVVIGLTEHDTTASTDRFDHSRVGLDHVAVACEGRAEVEAWADHLRSVGIDHSPIVEAPAGHVLVCRDPDGIAVEFFAPR